MNSITKDIKKHANDFIIKHYCELLKTAKKNYHPIFYNEINFDIKFVLWRHDCDYSLNRAYELARIENEMNVKSTYFINPHCWYYNIFEKSQTELIMKILDFGHKIGLHFDADYYDIKHENELDELVALEGKMLESFFDTQVEVFSFHDPTEYLLTCEKSEYGGMLNCYSRVFKDKVSYCSDSNGYWRNDRIHDVLKSAKGKYLQVLTHPGWWLRDVLQPRERILRAINGRRDNTIKLYDDGLKQFDRENISE